MLGLFDGLIDFKRLPGAEATHVERSRVEEALSSVGFTTEMQEMPVASLSGGWKMKLALARAMLMQADILLLDEPTNHLVRTYLLKLKHTLHV